MRIGIGRTAGTVDVFIDDAFIATGLDRALSIVQNRNTASRPVMGKLGWRQLRRGRDGAIDLRIYECTRREGRLRWVQNLTA